MWYMKEIATEFFSINFGVQLNLMQKVQSFNLELEGVTKNTKRN